MMQDIDIVLPKGRLDTHKDNKKSHLSLLGHQAQQGKATKVHQEPAYVSVMSRGCCAKGKRTGV
jgi:hypothetical protein